MVSLRHLYLSHVAQTGKFPLLLEVERAEGMYIFDTHGKKYLDLNSGISVSSIGHCHPEVVKAVQNQAKRYMHTMVYGEHIQNPQVELAIALTSLLHMSLNQVYFLNSGSEGVEAAIKLARKYTGRPKIIACSRAYHGSTIGAESLRSDWNFKRHFSPGIPGVVHVDYNDFDALRQLDGNFAAFILEPVQAEAGIRIPENQYLQKVREFCTRNGILMVLDEIQTGFGRTGSWFAHQKYDVVPDILLLGKSMGGGMPISAIVSDRKILSSFVKDPELGHITTFGGHPVCCAASNASIRVLQSTSLIEEVAQKEKLFLTLLKHEIIEEVRSAGLMMAVQLTQRKYLKYAVSNIIEKGALVDYFLFDDRSFRLAPPLIITESQIYEACDIIQEALDWAASRFK
ncbi:MAG TPA: aspartate aminotransferase family protein [Saprospiraceae bacterium]|nr:aspartate aminotransferase family protein [Saprospiraceae bacterium]